MTDDNTKTTGIAIIGMSGRFPGASSTEELWNVVREGKVCIKRFTHDEVRPHEPDPRILDRSNYILARGIIDGMEKFDASFFGYSPAEASILDPQHRIWLEVAWEALESAGYAHDNHGQIVSVYAGSFVSTYLLNNLLSDRAAVEEYVRGRDPAFLSLLTGNDPSFLATRTAHALDLRGPAINIQTGCSTSLVAVALAVQGLQSLESDIAIAGGVCLRVPQYAGYFYQEGAIPSKDGTCRPYDRDACGTVFGDGAAAVVLKRYSDAVRDHDPILAVIRSAAINNDGRDKMSYTAPSVTGQAEVIATALELAEVSADTIGYVEGHGTATPIGDPIEVEALTQAFREYSERRDYCCLGAIKGNIGHLDAAAGCVGLINAVQALRHQTLPPTAHFSAPNPELRLENSPFYVLSNAKQWPESLHPRRAGVSSFGVGGTNCHVVLEEAVYQTTPTSADQQARTYLLLTAQNEEALNDVTGNLGDWFEGLLRDGEAPYKVQDVAYTLVHRRQQWKHRRAVFVESWSDGVKALRNPTRWGSGFAHFDPEKLIFLLPGQGSLRSTVFEQLFRSDTDFKNQLGEVAQAASQLLDFDLWSWFQGLDGDDSALRDNARYQLATFAVDVALARWLAIQGVEPHGYLGHSLGELVALHLAGVLDLQDAVTAVFHRGTLMQQTGEGAATILHLSEVDAKHYVTEGITLACVNGERLSLLSGSPDNIARCERQLEADGHRFRRTPINIAVHSPVMDRVIPQFEERLRTLTWREPKRRVLSAVTGKWLGEQEIRNPAFWAAQVRAQVRYLDAATKLAETPNLLAIEVGLGSALASLTKPVLKAEKKQEVFALLPASPQDIESGGFDLRVVRGLLWAHGIPIDLVGTLEPPESPPALPTYPFQRQRYWVDAPAPGATSPSLRRESEPEKSDMESVEARVLKLFVQVLGTSDIGPEDSFFDLRGNSLLAVGLLSKIDFAFGVQLPLSSFYDNSTPAAVAGVLAQKLGEKPSEGEQTKPEQIAKPETTKEETARSFRATSSQQELWIASKLGGVEANLSYNTCLGIRFDGSLDTDALREAVNELVRRHEALRSVFADEGTTCRILPAWDTPLAVEDLSSLDEKESETALEQRKKSEVRTPFDLEQGPLFRTVLFRLAAESHYFIFSAHHIVFDGWSTSVVPSELAALYRSRRGDGSVELAFAASYQAYAEATNKRLASPAGENDVTWWLNHLREPLREIELPTDRQRPPLRTYDAHQIDYKLDAAVEKRLRKLAADARCTFLTVLFAGFNAYLYRLTGQRDLVIAIPAAGQPLFGGKSLIGHCVYTLPVRSDVDPNAGFLAHVERTRGNLVDVLEHQQITFSTLLPRLARPFDTSRIPLIPVCFGLFPEGPLDDFGDVQVSAELLYRDYDVFELYVNAVDSERYVELQTSYNSTLFDRSTVEQWLVGFETLLKSVVDDPERPIAHQSILGAGEQKIYDAYNSTTVEQWPGLVHEWISQRAIQSSDRVAVSFEDKALTYSELEIWSNSVASALYERGVRRGDRVGVCLQRSERLPVALLGVLKAGAAYVPMDPAYPRSRLAIMAEDGQLRMVVTESAIDSAPEGLECFLLDPQPCPETSTPFTSQAESDDLAYVIFTSGSTGRPKGVSIPHRGMANFIQTMLHEPGVTADDNFLAITTVSFDIAVLELFAPLVIGARCVIADREMSGDPQRLAAVLERESITLLQATPATWRLLLDSGWKGKRDLRAICGGEPLLADLAAGLLPKVAVLWNAYGPTEVTVWATLDRVESSDDITIGHPIDNTRVYILDEQLEPVPIGATGEIWLAGVQLAQGYIGRPDLTVERFIEHPKIPGERMYRTGDLGRLRAEGRLECLGRTDFQVKIRGFRVELGEIESALREADGIANAVVHPFGQGGDAILVAYVVPESGRSTDESQWRAALSDKLPPYMVPGRFVLMDALPLTPNGKIDRKALPAPGEVKSATYDPPQNDLEFVVAEVWTKALKIDRVGRNENFFSIGGQSLIATRVVAELRKRLNIPIELPVIFQQPTIADFANAIKVGTFNVGGSAVKLTSVACDKRLFCVCGVALYGGIAEALAPAVECWGVVLSVEIQVAESMRTGAALPALPTLDQMASEYIDAIRSIQAKGPYNLAGLCFGGIVAYEVARRLRQAGEEVRTLAMFDSAHPSGVNFEYNPIELVRQYGGPRPFTRHAVYRIRQIVEEKARSSFERDLKHSEDSELSDVEAVDFRDRTFSGLLPGYFATNPRYGGEMTLFQPLDRSEFPGRRFKRTLGWNRLVDNHIDVHYVPGNHLSILQSPNVSEIAKVLSPLLVAP